jgi:transcriptional regulator with XRE-family HTH domain
VKSAAGRAGGGAYKMSCRRGVEVRARTSQTLGSRQSSKEVDPFRDELRIFRKALGNRIRELRKLRAGSQEEFTDRAHIHRTFAGSPERGEKNASGYALVLISRCLGITLSELFAGLETGESVESTLRTRFRSRKVASDHGAMDRSRVLSEFSVLERSIRTILIEKLP